MSNGSIIKREGKTGVSYLLKYEAGVDPVTGKRDTRYETVRGTKKEAQAKLRELLSSVDKGTVIEPHKITLAQWAKEWLIDIEAKRKVSTRTAEGYANWIDLHINPVLGNVRLQQLTARQVDALYASLRERGDKRRVLSTQSVLHLHRTLFQLMKAATKKRLVVRNIMEEVDAPSPSKEKAQADRDDQGKIKFFTREELPRLMAAFKDDDFFPFVALSLATGFRIGETLALRWIDVDLDAQSVTVAGSIDRTKANGLRIKTGAKNRSSLRTIQIDAPTCDILRRHRNTQREIALRFGVKAPDDGLVFAHVLRRSRKGENAGQLILDFKQPYFPTQVTRYFQTKAARVGLGGRDVHALRHTHATLAIESGTPIPAVSKRLGHSTIATTIKVYAHVTPAGADQAAEAAARIMRDAYGF